MDTATAWSMIGWDDGTFRIRGGTAIYEAVIYNSRACGQLVKLARLQATGHGLRQINRFVPADTILEFFDATAFAKYCEEFSVKPDLIPA